MTVTAPATVAPARKGLILAAVCLCVLVVNLDTSIMNVTLPTLVRELDASTRDLQWIVDAYNLTFAALVLAVGSLSDRYGRRGALVVGLAVLGAFSVYGAGADTAPELIGARAGMGLGAAIVFPTTLSILSNVFTERRERAKAIGIWGAMTGLGVALGPITGGWLLEHFWWGSVLWVMVPIAVVGIALALTIIPTSRDPEAPRLDWGGLVLSTAAIGTLVFTIIEAPDRGWTSTASVAGFVAATLLAVLFVAQELRTAQPMMDVTLFRNLRFSAASGSVTVAFFALFGFIFLITQYFQFVKGYGAFSAGLRLIPVALSVGIGSVVGTRLAVGIGNKRVVAAGLTSMAIGFLWVSTASAATPYWEIAGQMVFLAGGLGLTSAPATEAIMGSVPKEKAGIGSAVNDATRELGGTLGVAVIGSVFASIYRSEMASSAVADRMPADALDAATESIGAALGVAARAGETAGPAAAQAVTDAAREAFLSGLGIGCLVAAGVALAGAAFAARYLPARPVLDLDDDAAATEPGREVPTVRAEGGAGAATVGAGEVAVQEA